MKFVLLMEEDGFELRYWDEITEEIRNSIITTWSMDEFYKELVDREFNISKDILKRAMGLIESGERDFVVLASKNKKGHLDTLYEDEFYIEN